MIDPFKPVRFYDDRGRDVTLIMHRMMYLDNRICVCLAYTQGFAIPSTPSVGDYVMFELESGKVLATDLDFYLAENYQL